MFAHFNKFIVAVVGLAVAMLKEHTGIDLEPAMDSIVNFLIPAATAAAVWFVPNKE